MLTCHKLGASPLLLALLDVGRPNLSEPSASSLDRNTKTMTTTTNGTAEGRLCFAFALAAEEIHPVPADSLTESGTSVSRPAVLQDSSRVGCQIGITEAPSFEN